MKSRKFLLTLLIIAIGVVMTYLGKLTPELVNLLTWAGGLYGAANVTQKAAEWFTQKATETP